MPGVRKLLMASAKAVGSHAGAHHLAELDLLIAIEGCAAIADLRAAGARRL